MAISFSTAAHVPGYGATHSNDVVSCYDVSHDIDNTCEKDNCLNRKSIWLLGGLMMLTAFVTKVIGSMVSPSDYRSHHDVEHTLETSVDILRLEHQSSACGCLNDEGALHCKSLLLLRHAKSSWKNSFFVDDINRHLSSEGIMVAHGVGRSLHHMNLKLPDLILSSPSTRTEETLNIGEWILGAGSHDYHKASKLNVKVISKQKHKRLNKELSKKDIDVLYVDELYTLADDNYLQHLKAMLNHNEPERVMIVGHNPAMELLLNEVTPATKQTFLPGQFYEICFPGLGSWSDLEQAVKEQRLGAVSFVLPHAKK